MAKSLQIQKQEWPLVLGIDIGSTSLKYFLIRRQAGKIRLLRFGRHRISDNFGPTDFSAAIQDLFKNNKSFRKAMVVVGVDGPNMIIKRETLPALSKKELAQAVLFSVQNEMGKEFGSVPLVTDYKQLSRKTDGVEYVLIGMPMDGVENRIKPFLAEGMVPVKVTANALALKRLLDFTPAAQGEEGAIGFLDIGASMSTLFILKERETDYFREIKVGGDDFSKAISGTIFHEGRAVQLTPEETMEFKQLYGYPMGYTEGMLYRGAPLSEIGAMMRPVVERFTGEVQRSLDFYRDKSQGAKIEKLYLIGGGSRLKHLSDALKERINLSVSDFPVPSMRMAGGKAQQEAFEKHFLEQAVSFALSLETATDCNLLPEPLKNTHRMKLAKTLLQWILGGILTILVIITGGLRQSNLKRNDDLSQLEIRAAFVQSRAAVYQTMLTKQAGLTARINAVRRESGRDETVSDLLKLFSHVVSNKITLLTLEFGEGVEQQPNERRSKEPSVPTAGWTVKVQGFNPKPPSDIRIHVAQLIMELEKSGFFSSIKCTHEVTDEKNNEYMFELTGILKKGRS
jgi:type IV pilus assembly protein PilM